MPRTLEERAQSAERGSRRKRDIEAYAEREDLSFEEAVNELAEEAVTRPPFTVDAANLPPDDIEDDPEAAGAWTAIRDRIRGSLPESAYLHWLAPVVAIGSRDGKLILETPRRLYWYADRYGAVLGELSRLHGYNGWAIYAGKGGPIGG